MPSAVSWTGMSSSTVTRWTAVRRDLISPITRSVWPRTAPTRARSPNSPLTLRNCEIRPVGGASSTTASYTRAFLLRELRSTAS